jgi:nicotinic acid mononucleotide adenylyltransferase
VDILFSLNSRNKLQVAFDPKVTRENISFESLKDDKRIAWSEDRTRQDIVLDEVKDLNLEQEHALIIGLSLFFWFMPEGDQRFYDVLVEDSFSLLEVSHRTSTTDQTRPWLFFGGAFDPWHKGHRACLELCRDHSLVVVQERGPWKDGTPTAFREFFKLVDETRDIALALYPGFLARHQAEPTVEWIQKVKGKKSFLVGADHLRDFSKWHEYKKLLDSLETLYVAPRAVHQNNLVDNELFYQWRDELQKSTATPIVILDRHPFEELSSTAIRNLLKL